MDWIVANSRPAIAAAASLGSLLLIHSIHFIFHVVACKSHDQSPSPIDID